VTLSETDQPIKKTRRIATANWWRISICGRPCKTLPHI